MDAKSTYAYGRVQRWVFNTTRHAAIFNVLCIIIACGVTLWVPAFGITALVIGLFVLGISSIETVVMGDPTERYFHSFDSDALSAFCKYYRTEMWKKGISAETIDLDLATLIHYHEENDMPWCYLTTIMLNKKARLGFRVVNKDEANELESVQQTELPAMPATEGVPDGEGNPTRNPDAGD